MTRITPRPEDAAALEAKRAALADKLDRHHWRERRIVAGTASPETIECTLSMRYLSRVLAGPVPDRVPRPRVGLARGRSWSP